MTLPASSARAEPAHDLFRRLFDRFAGCGRTAGGGVERLCASAADGEARAAFADALLEAGAETLTDGVGNQFGVFRLAGRRDAPLVMMGSHLDSQPKGGRFDGALGVAAAAGVGAALKRAAREGERFDADFCAVNWTNEEGARFRPSLLGSGVYLGRHRREAALACVDDDGVTLREALTAISQLGSDAPPTAPACYLELHVEQGTALETSGRTIGLVTACWGAAKFDVVFQGEQAHTGPCPMERRRDALLAAAYLIADARAIADRREGLVHSSVGRLVVLPNSANVVPAETRLSLEIRSPDDAVLREAAAEAAAAIGEAAERAGVVLARCERADRPVRALPEAAPALVERCATSLGHGSLRLATVAGHDALSFVGVCPTALVFVPSVGGVAHNEAEETADSDLQAGFDVMLEAATRLCRAGGVPEAA